MQAYVKWNRQNTETTLKCFRFVSELFQATPTMTVSDILFHMREVLKQNWWSAEVKQICFSFVSFLPVRW